MFHQSQNVVRQQWRAASHSKRLSYVRFTAQLSWVRMRYLRWAASPVSGCGYLNCWSVCKNQVSVRKFCRSKIDDACSKIGPSNGRGLQVTAGTNGWKSGRFVCYLEFQMQILPLNVHATPTMCLSLVSCTLWP